MLRPLASTSFTLINRELRHSKKRPQLIQARGYIKKSSSSFLSRLGSKKKSEEDDLKLYDHIVQVGDPVLRAKCAPVDPADIPGAVIQSVIAQLIKIRERYAAVGVSAPQIGVPCRVSVVACTEAELRLWPDADAAKQGMAAFPLTVLVNPTLKVTDNAVVSHRESCCSVNGLSAVVPRARAVEVSYLDAEGKERTWAAKEWAARVLQHELDHLNGVMFTDKMRSETLAFNYWETVNRRGGDFRLGFDGVGRSKSWRMSPMNFMKINQNV